MTVKLDLNPEVEAGLVAQARSRGLSLEAYLQQVLKERSAIPMPMKASEAAAKAREFRAFAKGHRPVGSLTDESLRREHLETGETLCITAQIAAEFWNVGSAR